jgi:hypothetical protein
MWRFEDQGDWSLQNGADPELITFIKYAQQDAEPQNKSQTIGLCNKRAIDIELIFLLSVLHL